MPCSAKVGTSGIPPARSFAATPSARTCPACIAESEDGSAVKAIGVCPPTVAWTAGAAPVNGTCTRSRLNASRNSSPPRCGVEPTPGPAKLYLPGLSRMSCTSSGSVLAGTDGLTTTTFGESLRHDARDDVGRTARREADHHAHRPVRISLRQCCRHAGQQQRGCEKYAQTVLHGALPWICLSGTIIGGGSVQSKSKATRPALVTSSTAA